MQKWGNCKRGLEGKGMRMNVGKTKHTKDSKFMDKKTLLLESWITVVCVMEGLGATHFSVSSVWKGFIVAVQMLQVELVWCWSDILLSVNCAWDMLLLWQKVYILEMEMIF